MAGTRAKKSRPSAQNSEQARTRILEAFSERAKRSGIRSVVMGELASDLRMSIATLYDHFASKEELVAAMVDRWCTDLATHEAMIEEEGLPAVERLMIWAEAWSQRVINYSPAFWSDLAREYPTLWTTLQKDLDRRKAKGEGLLRPHLREDVIPGIAFALLNSIFAHAHDPRLCDELGVSRRDAIRTSLSIWARGALDVKAVPARRKR